jgi:DNA-binding CsgD family transcriptional regulator
MAPAAHDEALARVLAVAPADGAALLTCEPAGMMFTGGAVQGLPAASCHSFFEIEVGSTSPRSFAALARSRRASVWSQDCSGGRAAPARGAAEADQRLWEDFLAPWGYVDELRVAFLAAGSCWGVVSLVRSRRGFSDRDRDALAAAAGGIGSALRAAALHAWSATSTHETAVVIFEGPDVVEATERAREWLPELRDPSRHRTDVYRGLDYLRALLAHEHDAPVHVRADDGRLLTAHAQALDGGRLAVVLAPAAPTRVVDSVLRAHGLTPREAEVCLLMCRGDSDQQIARALGVTLNTAQGFAKAVRTKLGVPSRAAVAGLLFAGHYFDDFLSAVSARHAAPSAPAAAPLRS